MAFFLQSRYTASLLGMGTSVSIVSLLPLPNSAVKPHNDRLISSRNSSASISLDREL